MRILRTSLTCLALAVLFATPAFAQATKSDSVVKIEPTAGKLDADGKQIVTLKIKIDEGWHLYANPVPKEFPGIPVEVKYAGKSKPATFKVDYPKGKEVKDETIGAYRVYEENAEVTVNIQRAKDDTGPLELTVKVQACTDKKCLLPATVKVTVP